MGRASKSKGSGTGRGKGRSKATKPDTDTTLTPSAEPAADKASGVHFDPEGPTFDVPLTAEEREHIATEICDTQAALDDKVDEFAVMALGHKREIRRMRKSISRLAREYNSGVRRVPAQADLPHTNGVANGSAHAHAEPTADELAAADAAFEADGNGDLPPPSNGVTDDSGVTAEL